MTKYLGVWMSVYTPTERGRKMGKEGRVMAVCCPLAAALYDCTVSSQTNCWCRFTKVTWEFTSKTQIKLETCLHWLWLFYINDDAWLLFKKGAFALEQNWVPVLPLSPGASWPWIDAQMLPWWGGRGQGRRGAQGSCWISLPQNTNGTGQRKEG